MRSLFTNDIPGAVPRHRYYEKELYLRRHLEEVERFGHKNPEQKRVIQWYDPPKKVPEPLDKNSSIVKPHNMAYREQSNDSPTRMSKSVILNKIDSVQITGKVTEGISLRRSGSIFSEAGKSSLESSFTRDHEENPYFPHRLPKKHEQNVSLLTGKREWKGDHISHIDIPSANDQYFPKWA